MAFTGVKVFSATKAREREELGENVTRWIRANPGVQVTDKIVTQTSDREFHCLTITLFYAHAEAQAARAPNRPNRSRWRRIGDAPQAAVPA